MRRPARIAAPALAVLMTVAPRHGVAQASRESAVGMPARIEQVVLPGPELVPVPAEPKSKLLLRLIAVYPHGSAFRYDLEFVGLEPGDYDLKDFLVRKDGSPLTGTDLPSVPVAIRSVLPPGHVLPNPLESRETPRLGGYRTLLIAGGAVWLAGLAAILFVRRKRSPKPIGHSAEPTTLADLLKPLVEQAIAGRLPSAECARLELALVALWRKRLGLEDLSPAEALKTLRVHAEAGPLLTGLETWLHRPALEGTVDLLGLLAPYRNLPPEALDGMSRAHASSRT